MLYMDESELADLTTQGHVVGIHGHSHIPFSRLGSQLFTDVGTDAEFISRATGYQPTWVSYPYGRDDAIPSDAILAALFRRFGLQIGVTLTGTWIEQPANPRRLQRINTNQLIEVAAMQ